MKILFRLRNIKNAIKFFFQRAIRGYSDKDVWSIDSWFLTIMPKMLRQLKRTTHGAPQWENMTSEGCHVKWKKILERMIYLLKEMDEDKCSYENPFEEAFTEYVQEKFSNKEGFKKNSDLEKLFLGEEQNKANYINLCKKEFFDLFSKYFYDLWD